MRKLSRLFIQNDNKVISMKFFVSASFLLTTFITGYFLPLLPVAIGVALICLILLLFLPKHRNLKKNFYAAGAFELFTIIIPSFNEGETLGKTLESLLNSDYPKNSFEIIVVYKPSEQDIKTPKLAKELTRNYRNIIFYKHYGSKAQALNYAIGKTKYDWIGLLDADNIIKKDFLSIASSYAKFCNKQKIECFIGSYRVGNKDFNALTTLQAIDMFQIREAVTKLGEWLGEANFHGYNGFFKKALLQKFKFQPHHPTEDVNLSSRLMTAGIIRLHAPMLLTNYNAVASLKELWHQRKRWARGNCRILFEEDGLGRIVKDFLPKTKLFVIIYHLYSNLSVLLLLTLVSLIGASLTQQTVINTILIIIFMLYITTIASIYQNIRERTISLQDIYSILYPFFFILCLGFIYLIGFSEEILHQRFVWVKVPERGNYERTN
ncbi:glycosyltransferase family 2 protein [Candidatus Parcubacteria bacterium]|nr:MAG: glycosyltransferase family 2 protein [Candidatus Parcubacteria bacterium]